jgi:DNA-directed RNA polymerases I, II, and III subunit RPABC2
MDDDLDILSGSEDEVDKDVKIKEELIEEQLILDAEGDGIDDDVVEEEEDEDSGNSDSTDEYIDILDEDIDITESVINTNDIVSVHETYSDYYTSTKITSPFLTKFERAKVIGIRAQMLASGAEPMISPPFPEECYDIAVLELKAKKIPLIIRRYLPNKKFEDWRLEDLIIKNV